MFNHDYEFLTIYRQIEHERTLQALRIDGRPRTDRRIRRRKSPTVVLIRTGTSCESNAEESLVEDRHAAD